ADVSSWPVAEECSHVVRCWDTPVCDRPPLHFNVVGVGRVCVPLYPRQGRELLCSAPSVLQSAQDWLTLLVQRGRGNRSSGAPPSVSKEEEEDLSFRRLWDASVSLQHHSEGALSDPATTSCQAAERPLKVMRLSVGPLTSLECDVAADAVTGATSAAGQTEEAAGSPEKTGSELQLAKRRRVSCKAIDASARKRSLKESIRGTLPARACSAGDCLAAGVAPKRLRQLQAQEEMLSFESAEGCRTLSAQVCRQPGRSGVRWRSC
ncbi:unnamed protein product, partial [Polarella glacialis]